MVARLKASRYDNSHYTFAITISSAWAGRAPCLGRGNVGRLLTQGSGPRELRSQWLIGAPEATNRDCEFLRVAEQVRILDVVTQAQVVSVPLTILCSIPEIRAPARAEIAIGDEEARWEGAKTILIYTMTIAC